MLAYLAKLNRLQDSVYGDPEIENRIAQYEMAFRMQTSVPEVMDLSNETNEVFDLYGPESRTPGTYAANCIMARKLLDNVVNFEIRRASCRERVGQFVYITVMDVHLTKQ